MNAAQLLARPPLSVEIAELRAELARTSLQRPGERARIREKIAVLEIVRDVAAKHYPQTSADAVRGTSGTPPADRREITSPGACAEEPGTSSARVA